MVCTLDTIRARGRCRGSSHVVAPRRVTLVQRMLVGGNLPPRIPSLNHSLVHFHTLSLPFSRPSSLVYSSFSAMAKGISFKGVDAFGKVS